MKTRNLILRGILLLCAYAVGALGIIASGGSDDDDDDDDIETIIFGDSGQVLGSFPANSLKLNDIDGDGDLDLVTGNGDAKANRIYINDSSGNFTDSGQELGNNSTQSVALGDIDTDGDLDIATGNSDNQANRIYINDGTGNFTDSGQALGLNSTFTIALGDIDSDGDLDLVDGGQNTYIYNNDGNGSFIDSGQMLVSAASVVLGDLDSDGDLDLVIGRFHDDLIYLNDGMGNFVDSGQMLDNSGTSEIALGDLDNDGDKDLVVGRPVVAFLSGPPEIVYTNDGNANFALSHYLQYGLDTSSVTLGDVDGDGDLDLISGYKGPGSLDNLTPGAYYGNGIGFNDGSGHFTEHLFGPGDYTPTSIILGDVDGDGDLDLVKSSGDVLGGAGGNRIYLYL